VSFLSKVPCSHSFAGRYVTTEETYTSKKTNPTCQFGFEKHVEAQNPFKDTVVRNNKQRRTQKQEVSRSCLQRPDPPVNSGRNKPWAPWVL